MSSLARFEQADPLGDTGRLKRLQDLCELAGVPSLAMHLFEAGIAPDNVLTGFARSFGVLPRRAPFPDLLIDPALWPAD